MPSLEELNKQTEDELVVEFDDSKGLSWDHNLAQCPYTRSRYIESLIKILKSYIHSTNDPHLKVVADYALDKLDYPIKEFEYTEEEEGESITKVIRYYGMISFERLSHSLNKRQVGRPKEDKRRTRRIRTYLAIVGALHCLEKNIKSEESEFKKQQLEEMFKFGITNPDDFYTRQRVARLRKIYMKAGITELKNLKEGAYGILQAFFGS